jgi:hypothetical protein
MGWMLGLVACAHTPDEGSSADALAVTEVAARSALDHDVPAVDRNAAPICLEVDGRPPPPELLARLSSGPVQVFGSGTACAGPRAVRLQVSGVVVSGTSAVARAGVQLGASGVLELRKLDGQWRVLKPAGQTGSGQGRVQPGEPLVGP